MKRRGFLKGLGGLAAGLAVGVGFKPSKPTPAKIDYSLTKVSNTSIADEIFYIDFNESPLLSVMGKGGTFRIEDWPNHKLEWIEDTNRPYAYGQLLNKTVTLG